MLIGQISRHRAQLWRFDWPLFFAIFFICQQFVGVGALANVSIVVPNFSTDGPFAIDVNQNLVANRNGQVMIPYNFKSAGTTSFLVAGSGLSPYTATLPANQTTEEPVFFKLGYRSVDVSEWERSRQHLRCADQFDRL